MSTTGYGEEIKLARAPAAEGVLTVVRLRSASVWRLIRNRIAANAIYELDPRQLDDIGLTLRDVHKARDHSGLMDDPTRLLAGVARERARDRFRRPARG